MYLEIALKYKIKQSKNGKFPSNYKASSILKRKLPSIDKPLRIQAPPKVSHSKRAFEKYKPRGLFSDFYGRLEKLGKEETDKHIYREIHTNL